MNIKYFIYCRKSSESEDKQILSLPAQERELREYAAKCNLQVVGVVSESKSAFKIGREGFSSMLQRISSGEASGILTWQTNRIARNSKDGGDFIYLMDEGKIQELKTPYKTFTNSPDDKFFLALEFGIAKKESDEKSKNVKRGNREKFLNRREWLGPAKIGYLNYCEPYTKAKKIVTDKERLPLLQKAVKLFLTGSFTAMEVLDKLNHEWGFRTRKTKKLGGKPLCPSAFYKFLSDSFYYGLMTRVEGSVMGTHQTIMTKAEFHRIQIMLGRHSRHSFTKHEFPFKGVLRCGECGAAITAEHKWQIICPECKTKFNRGKNTIQCPNCKTYVDNMKGYKLLHYTYFHCTKRAHPDCTQRSITIEDLEAQIDKELQKFEISQEFRDWAIKNLNQLNNKETEDREIVRTNFKETYEDCVKKLDNLLKLKISPQNIKGEVISEEEYIKQRKELLEQKEDLLSKITDTNQRMNNWYELTERTFDFACYARYWFNHGDLKTKTSILAALGSNITLKDKNLSIVGAKPFFLVEKCLSTIKAEIPEFEPTKSIDFTSNSYVFNFINSHLLRGRDSNPDYILQRDACYRYTTPQWVNFTKIRLCFLTIQIFPNTKLIYFRSFGASERQEAQGPWGKYLSFKFLLLLHQFWENHGGFHSKNERRGWRKNYRNRNFPICRKAGFRSAGLSPKFFFLLRQNLFSIFFDLLHKDRGFSENR